MLMPTKVFVNCSATTIAVLPQGKKSLGDTPHSGHHHSCTQLSVGLAGV
jgi:hypothetical protein